MATFNSSNVQIGESIVVKHQGSEKRGIVVEVLDYGVRIDGLAIVNYGVKGTFAWSSIVRKDNLTSNERGAAQGWSDFKRRYNHC